MRKPIFKYDELSDTLYVSFAKGEKGTGIELNEQILLRVNLEENRAIGLTLFNYSILAQSTQFGFRSLPLRGLESLPDGIREKIVKILTKPPVNEVLSLSAYTPSIVENIPITSLRSEILEKQAA